jgi:hypothetical protein
VCEGCGVAPAILFNSIASRHLKVSGLGHLSALQAVPALKLLLTEDHHLCLRPNMNTSMCDSGGVHELTGLIQRTKQTASGVNVMPQVTIRYEDLAALTHDSAVHMQCLTLIRAPHFPLAALHSCACTEAASGLTAF